MRLVLAALLVATPGLAHAHGGETAWNVPAILAATALAATAALYLRGLHRGAPVRRTQALGFAAGWLAAAVSVATPFDRLVAESFALHMVQHELLMVVAPPLLILGQPFAALAASLPPGVLRLAAWPLRIPPPLAWGAHAAALWMWHVPRFFDAAVASTTLHALQHASFFFTALLFWWTVIRRVRRGTAALYILTTIIHTGALAALLTFAPLPLYAGASLEQQQLGGLVMWVPAGYAMLLAGLLAFNRLLEAHA